VGDIAKRPDGEEKNQVGKKRESRVENVVHLAKKKMKLDLGENTRRNQ